MIAAEPSKRFFLHKRLFVILDHPVQGLFPQEPGKLVVLTFVYWNGAAIFKVPWGFRSSRIILYMFNIATSFENQCFQSFITQLLCGPAAAGTRTYHNCIVGSVFNCIDNVWHRRYFTST